MEADEIVFYNQCYTVKGYGGVAWYAKRWPDKEQLAEYWDYRIDEWIPDPDYGEVVPDDSGEGGVVMVMVGDDTEFVFDLVDLDEVNDDVCSCGQIGCEWE